MASRFEQDLGTLILVTASTAANFATIVTTEIASGYEVIPESLVSDGTKYACFMFLRGARGRALTVVTGS